MRQSRAISTSTRLHRPIPFLTYIKRLIVAGVLGMAMGYLSCTENKEKPLPLFQIGESTLYSDELSRAFGGLSPEDSATRASLYIEDWKLNTILFEAARSEGLDKQPEVLDVIEKMKRRLVVQAYIDQRISEERELGGFQIDSSEVKEYFDRSRGEFIYTLPMMKVLRLYGKSEKDLMDIQKVISTKQKPEWDTLPDIAASLVPTLADMNLGQKRFLSKRLPITKLYFETPSLRAIAEAQPLQVPTKPLKLADSLFVILTVIEKSMPGERMPYEEAFDDVVEKLSYQKEKRFVDFLLRESLIKLENKKGF